MEQAEQATYCVFFCNRKPICWTYDVVSSLLCQGFATLLHWANKFHLRIALSILIMIDLRQIFFRNIAYIDDLQ